MVVVNVYKVLMPYAITAYLQALYAVSSLEAMENDDFSRGLYAKIRANQLSKFYRNLHFINLSFPSRTQSHRTGIRK